MHYSKFVAKASVLNIYFGENFKNKKSIKKQIDIEQAVNILNKAML